MTNVGLQLSEGIKHSWTAKRQGDQCRIGQNISMCIVNIILTHAF